MVKADHAEKKTEKAGKPDAKHAEELNRILLQRAVIYPDSELHGSIAGFYDYGSVGSEIKRRWQDYWRAFFLNIHDNFHEIESTQMMPEKVFKGPRASLRNVAERELACEKHGEQIIRDGAQGAC